MAVADVYETAHDSVATTLHRYGLGTLFAGNVLGAGSVYILSETGATTGFALLWVLPIALALDMVLHDLGARLAADGRPLMTYIRSVIGHRPAVGFAVAMAGVMQLWAVANYAVAGAALSWLLGVPTAIGICIAASAAIALMLTRKYKRVESVICGLLLALFGAYIALALGLDVHTSDLLAGFSPGAFNEGTLIIAMLGTTVYYPNFYIQSSIRPTKGWTSVSKYRRDNAAGVIISGIVSAAILTVAATTLSGIGELSLTTPATPLVSSVGAWALPAFVLGVLAASFTSATGTLFGACYAVPQSLGHHTEFGDARFTIVSIALISISAIVAVAMLDLTAFTPVRMAIVMPAINGAVFLPVTLFAMYAATRHDLSRRTKAIVAVALLVLSAGSVLTAQSLADTITSFL